MSTSIAIAFGRVLRRLRVEAGITQEDLGLEADLQRKYISLLELGHKQPTITTVFKLASALNIKPGKILTLTESELSDPHGTD